MVDDFRKAFIDEASELLSDLEISLLDLERRPNDSSLISKVFRALHTIKGSSGMFGYPNISEFTHNVETVFHHVRIGEIQITKEIIDLTLLARDHIYVMLGNQENNHDHKVTVEKEILLAIQRIIPERNSKI